MSALNQHKNPGGLAKKWRLRLVCCGRDDGIAYFGSEDDAESFRNSYTSGSGVDPRGYSAPEYGSAGHRRAAIKEYVGGADNECAGS